MNQKVFDSQGGKDSNQRKTSVIMLTHIISQKIWGQSILLLPSYENKNFNLQESSLDTLSSWIHLLLSAA